MGFTLIPVCQFHPLRLFLPSRLRLVPGFGNPTCEMQPWVPQDGLKLHSGFSRLWPVQCTKGDVLNPFIRGFRMLKRPQTSTARISTL